MSNVNRFTEAEKKEMREQIRYLHTKFYLNPEPTAPAKEEPAKEEPAPKPLNAIQRVIRERQTN